MSQTDKAAFYKALKAAGVTFDKHYREYSTEELATAYTALKDGGAITEPVPPYAPVEPPETITDPAWTQAPAATQQPRQAPPQPPVRAQADPKEMAGQRLNSKAPDEVIRIDELGRHWLQEEVLKPAYPKPRGRRVLDYVETGTKMVETKNGDYVESFEVAGDQPGRAAQVKITLPSYQVGIYRDPRFPFKVVTYNGNEGFDLFEVQDYYSGAEMVPAEIKRKYVENVLCYDIRTVIRAIQTEYRQLQLAGKVQ